MDGTHGVWPSSSTTKLARTHVSFRGFWADGQSGNVIPRSDGDPKPQNKSNSLLLCPLLYHYGYLYRLWLNVPGQRSNHSSKSGKQVVVVRYVEDLDQQ